MPALPVNDHLILASRGSSPSTLSSLAAIFLACSVHLIILIGFRNKLAVPVQWTYSNFAYKRDARIVTGVSEAKKG